jgi:hypothetical protein
MGVVAGPRRPGMRGRVRRPTQVRRSGRRLSHGRPVMTMVEVVDGEGTAEKGQVGPTPETVIVPTVAPRIVYPRIGRPARVGSVRLVVGRHVLGVLGPRRRAGSVAGSHLVDHKGVSSGHPRDLHAEHGVGPHDVVDQPLIALNIALLEQEPDDRRPDPEQLGLREDALVVDRDDGIGLGCVIVVISGRQRVAAGRQEDDSEREPKETCQAMLERGHGSQGLSSGPTAGG